MLANLHDVKVLQTDHQSLSYGRCLKYHGDMSECVSFEIERNRIIRIGQDVSEDFGTHTFEGSEVILREITWPCQGEP